jgi:hypothetical protein
MGRAVHWGRTGRRPWRDPVGTVGARLFRLAA